MNVSSPDINQQNRTSFGDSDMFQSFAAKQTNVSNGQNQNDISQQRLKQAQTAAMALKSTTQRPGVSVGSKLLAERRKKNGAGIGIV